MNFFCRMNKGIGNGIHGMEFTWRWKTVDFFIVIGYVVMLFSELKILGGIWG